MKLEITISGPQTKAYLQQLEEIISYMNCAEEFEKTETEITMKKVEESGGLIY